MVETLKVKQSCSPKALRKDIPPVLSIRVGREAVAHGSRADERVCGMNMRASARWLPGSGCSRQGNTGKQSCSKETSATSFLKVRCISRSAQGYGGNCNPGPAQARCRSEDPHRRQRPDQPQGVPGRGLEPDPMLLGDAVETMSDGNWRMRRKDDAFRTSYSCSQAADRAPSPQQGTCCRLHGRRDQ